ncbi:MAG TPA: hypothetical protein VKB50_29950 [Vicinamibacterales bacterium]|nr:hypothetical protein [Vicinamibacterales bacterium]
MWVRLVSTLSIAGSLLAACGSDPGSAPTGVSLAARSIRGGAPTGVTLVARGGFKSPVDAVASPEGKTFYFSARTEGGEPAVFRVSSHPGSVATVMVTGAPLSAPRGLVLSCDGSTLYVAGGDSPIYELPTAGGALRDLGVTGIREIAGLAIGTDCGTLFASGRTADNRPALFRINAGGGSAQVVFAGAPLVAPTGLYVDRSGVTWVMDLGANQTGALYAVPPDGSAAKLVGGDLPTSNVFAGVSLISSGDTAVIATRGQLTTIELASGERSDVPVPGIIAPAGLRTARRAAVFAIADIGGDAIFRAD